MDAALVARLDSEEHVIGLRWFEEHVGEATPWPEPPGDLILATHAKGIFKPKWMPYALSIRRVPQNRYDDSKITRYADGSWSFKYAQEVDRRFDPESPFTNRGLKTCIDKHFPVGVLWQEREREPYEVLGLAMPIGWDAGFFFLESYKPDGNSVVDAYAGTLEGPAERIAYSPVDQAEEAVEAAAGRLAGRGRGQGFQLDQEVKRAVEGYAMDAAVEFYRAGSWTVRDVHSSESYDLLCRRGEEVKHVEVKGTTTDGAQVILTPNEVRHARENNCTALFVLSNIRVVRAVDGTVAVSGGVRHRNDPWDVDDGTLTPLGFRYQVPAQQAEDG